ncbi:MAG TPA: PDZ domain-containing protein [Polyangiales bacterium]|nr:PDZ domain-containing protein [Polyangiales bacterium]
MDVVSGLGVDSPVISVAAPLELRAEGLPSGRRVQVALRGRLAAAGQDERELDVSLLGQVLSPERLSVAVDPALIARWGRATFDGSLVVDCDPPAPRGCHGTLAQARFDVELAAERRGQPLHYAVERLLPTLGLEISDADSATYGLLVSEVLPGSLAARAGLRKGDTIVRSNGVSLHALADLAPGPRADALSLWVRRDSGPLLKLRVPLADAPPLADPRLLGLCLVASPLLLLLLSRLGMPAPAVLMSGLASRIAALRASAGWPLLFGAVLSVLLSICAALGARLFDPFVLLSAHLGGVVLLTGVRAEGGKRLALDVLGVWGAVLCVAAVSGTRAWPILLRDQGHLPWAWNAFSRLPLTAACVLFVLAAAQLHGPRAERRFAAQCWDEGLCALLAALGSGLFFGGSFVAPTAGALELAFGGVVAALKGLTCYALLRVVDGSMLQSRRNWLWVILIGVTPLWVRLAPSRSFELIWGSVVCVLGVCIALAGLVSVRSTRARTSAAEPQQPTAATAKTARAKSAHAKPAPRRRAARSAEPGVIAAPRAARLR